MKIQKQLFAIFALALFASVSEAQSLKTTQSYSNDGVSSEGVRISVLRPMLDMKVTSSEQQSANFEIESTWAFGLGYASLPVNSLGWMANINYLQLSENNSDVGMVRLDGSLAYAFTSNVYAKGGINLSKFAGGLLGEMMDPSIGFQAGLGFQITQTFGLEAGYTQMNQRFSHAFASVNTRQSGLELGINATF